MTAMEERLKVPQNSRFPLYRQLMWHAAQYYTDCLNADLPEGKRLNSDSTFIIGSSKAFRIGSSGKTIKLVYPTYMMRLCRGHQFST